MRTPLNFPGVILIKKRLLVLQTLFKTFFLTMYLAVWQHAKMHQNLFLSSPDVNKYIFNYYVPGSLAVFAAVPKFVFSPSDDYDYLFLIVCANVSKLVLNHSRH
jgi:hypothetical protein